MIAGLGNSVFHPADFALLNASVDQSRLGRAYSIHGVGGSLGWAAAPVMYFLDSMFGWVGAALIGAIHASDLPMVQTLAFIFAVLIVLFNLIADILYGFLDPRIRYD